MRGSLLVKCPSVNCSRAEAISMPAARPPSAVGRGSSSLGRGVQSSVVMKVILSGVAVASSASATAIVGTFGSSRNWKFSAPLPEGQSNWIYRHSDQATRSVSPVISWPSVQARPRMDANFDTVLTPHAVVRVVLASGSPPCGEMANSPDSMAEDFSKLRSDHAGQPASAAGSRLPCRHPWDQLDVRPDRGHGHPQPDGDVPGQGPRRNNSHGAPLVNRIAGSAPGRPPRSPLQKFQRANLLQRNRFEPVLW